MLLHIDGFEDHPDRLAGGRDGGYCIRGYTWTPPTPLMIVTAGCAARAYAGVSGGVLQFDRLSVTVSPSLGNVQLRRANDTLQTSPPGILPPDDWFYIEAMVRIHDTEGFGIVRVNGVEVINFTGDTRYSADSTSVESVSSSSLFEVDDFYASDTTGPAPYNGFLGDCRVETLVPAGNGDVTQLVGSDADSVDNWQLVDDLPPDMADYVESDTVGARDLYTITGATAVTGTTIHGVQVAMLAEKSEAGATSSVAPILKTGGTEHVGDPLTLGTGALTVQGVPQVTDPDGNAWTPATVNATQVGVEVQ